MTGSLSPDNLFSTAGPLWQLASHHDAMMMAVKLRLQKSLVPQNLSEDVEGFVQQQGRI